VEIITDKPFVIKGESHHDIRGCILFNNHFDLIDIRRFYEIENIRKDYIRGWKGHTIERRWFTATKGIIKINVVSFDINKKLYLDNIFSFELNSNTKDVLFVPANYATSIIQITKNAKVLAMSDYLLNETFDELRWEN
jgi:dTDP-4-dehydrorhamnose 3,5-epimerase-like enzyme